MLNLCQRDPKWASASLGNSPYQIGRYGCTITCLSMLTDYFTKFDGSWKSPDQLGQKLDFTADGLIIWGSLSKATQFRLEKRLYGENDPEIDISLQDPKKAVILEVDHYHWVVAIGKNWFGRYKIIDPWFGDRASITRYHAITGSAHMILN